jgi:2',3'-cyclic-nucleotide 2'-phosphodiesterase (5'-nucleotidase family)
MRASNSPITIPSSLATTAIIIAGLSLSLSWLERTDGFAFHLHKVSLEVPENPDGSIVDGNKHVEGGIGVLGSGAFGVTPVLPKPGRSGGRSSGFVDMPSLENWATRWEPTYQEHGEARLTIVQVTDVYTLENFASLKTMLEETKEKCTPGSVVSMLTGDFLSPYLLSSVDRGYGMMNALAKAPIDYLTWGNHEADIDHRTVCRHVRGFPGTWLNSNMQDHEEMEHQKPFDVIEVCSPDGSNKRRIGLIAVLSNDPALYSHFKAPGAFGGATIDDPWETLAKYKELLEGPEYNCDMVIPLQHLYVPDDHRTCREFDFDVILSGHDHHRVDEVIDGTRLIKPGMNGDYATAMEISWKTSKDGDVVADTKPDIRATFVRTQDWQADPLLEEENDRAYDALAPLRNTELASIPEPFFPLTSADARGSVCTMGQYICTLLRSSLNKYRSERGYGVDAVLVMGGNVRGGTEYPADAFFSLEALEAEIKSDETVAVVPMPGWLLEQGIIETHAGDPIPGWMQYDVGVTELNEPKRMVTHVAGEPIDHDRIYNVVTKVPDLTNGQSATFTDFFTEHPEYLPPKGAYVNIHSELMGFFARNLFTKVWDAVSPDEAEPCALDMEAEFSEDDIVFAPPYERLCIELGDCNPEQRLRKLDRDGDGIVTVDDIHHALKNLVGLSVHEEEKSLARFVHAFADTTGNGEVTLSDFKAFCKDLPAVYEAEKWRLAKDVKEEVVVPEPIIEPKAEEEETAKESKPEPIMAASKLVKTRLPRKQDSVMKLAQEKRQKAKEALMEEQVSVFSLIYDEMQTQQEEAKSERSNV